MRRAKNSKPVQALEIMTDFNKRTTVGRVVVNPPTRMAPLNVHETGDVWIFCLTCGRAFLHKDKLQEHLKDHEEENQEIVLSKPQVVQNEFHKSIKLSSKALAASKPKKYYYKTTDGQFQCRHCLKKFANSSKCKNHVVALHENLRPYKCDQCGASFNFGVYLRKHVQKSHSTLHAFKCGLCSCRFEKEQGLNLHKTMYHDKNSAFKKKKISPNSSESQMESQPMYSSSRQNSTKPIHRFKQIQHKSGIDADSVSGLDKMEVKNLQCNICQKVLCNKRSLRNHKLTHSDYKEYMCKHCGNRFKYYATLHKHIKRVHFALATLRCSYCTYSNTNKGLLKDHLTSVHDVVFL